MPSVQNAASFMRASCFQWFLQTATDLSELVSRERGRVNDSFKLTSSIMLEYYTVVSFWTTFHSQVKVSITLYYLVYTH